MNSLVQGMVSNKTLRRFFQMYKNASEGKATVDEISIKALAFNYQKFKKAETEVINILSEKAMKDRYAYLKLYNEDFDVEFC